MSRKNPPVDYLPSKFEPLIRAGEGRIRRLGAKHLHHPLGCGKFGCTFKKDGHLIVKVTRDPSEVRMVKEILRLRGDEGTVSPSTRAHLARIGTTPEKAKWLPGIVDYTSAPKSVGKRAWAYTRENVSPLDAMKDRRLLRRVRKALDLFYYSGRSIDPVAFLNHYPELRLIVQTEVFLRLAHRMRLDDIHEEQAGLVLFTSSLHRKGDLVIYDGQTR